METIGFIGSLLLAICALPLTIEAIKEKKVTINNTLLTLWFSGELLVLIYVLGKHGFDLPLLTNYVSNIILLLPVIYYKWKD